MAQGVIAAVTAATDRGASLAFTLPAAPLAGDWLIAYLACSDNVGTSTVDAFALPSGWPVSYNELHGAVRLQMMGGQPATLSQTVTFDGGATALDAPLAGVLVQVRPTSGGLVQSGTAVTQATTYASFINGMALAEAVTSASITADPSDSSRVWTLEQAVNASISVLVAYTDEVPPNTQENPSFGWAPLGGANFTNTYRIAAATDAPPVYMPPFMLPDNAMVAGVSAGATHRPAAWLAGS